MADYKEALEAGFAAAKKAEVARKEVLEVLNKLEADILAATDGKVLIKVSEVEEPKYLPTDPKNNFLQRSVAIEIAAAYAMAMREPKKYYSALTASNPKVEGLPFKELARWKQAKEGYPCSLFWNKEERQCEDRTALEEGLAELLKDPGIGEKLYALTKLA